MQRASQVSHARLAKRLLHLSRDEVTQERAGYGMGTMPGYAMMAGSNIS